MRALLQRVRSGRVLVDEQEVASIGRGFVILLGVTHADTEDSAVWLAKKISGIRLFEDQNGKMNLSLEDVNGSVLVVSQYTLYADAKKGRRPSFIDAARPEKAEPLIECFTKELRTLGIPVATGLFGARMEVEIHNDGPVTLMIEQ